MAAQPDIPDGIWRWVRGEIANDDFAYWLFGHADEVTAALPQDVVAHLMDLDYWEVPVFSSEAEHTRRRFFTELPRWCACPLMFDRQMLPLGRAFMPPEFDRSFETLATRTPWLSLVRCRKCGQHWYAAFDIEEAGWWFERLAPDLAGRVLTARQWPSTFDGLANVWPRGAPLPQPAGRPEGFKGYLIDNFEGNVPG